MKKIIVILSVLTITSFLYAEDVKNNDKTKNSSSSINDEIKDQKIIIPGEGCGKIKIGAATDEITSFLGEPTSVSSYDDEVRGWSGMGYDLNKEPLFVIGFDKMYQYDNIADRTSIPVWKIYFKEGRVIYIIFSSFGIVDEAVTYGLNNQCTFGKTDAELYKAAGKGYYYKDASGNENYFYFKKGLLAIVIEKKLRVLQVFRPFSADMERSFLLNMKSGN